MSDDLPEGWTSARLGDTCSKPQYGYTASARVGEAGPRFLRITDIQEGRVDWSRVPTCEIDRGDSDRFALAPGDIVFARSGATTGKSYLITECPPAVFASYLIRVRTGPSIVPRYLHLWFQSPAYWSYIAESVAGNAQPNCNASKLEELAVRLPPLAEQRRIVAKVEALLEHVRRAKDRLDRVPLILRQFRQAVLAAACSGSLTESWRSKLSLGSVRESISERLRRNSQSRTRRGVPERVELPDDLAERELPTSWTWTSVAELLRASFLLDVKDGNHGANHPKVADFSEEGIPFITAAQVNDFAIDYAGAYKLAGPPLEMIHVGHAKPGDAILTHKGSVGRTAVCERHCVLTPQTTYYRPDPETIDARFLMYLFAAPAFYGQLAAVMSQTTRDFVPISEQYRLFLTLPTLNEQREIVRRVDSLFTLATALEQRVKRAAAAVGNLSQAILSKAFAGELVANEAALARAEGRDYETAQHMLLRLREVGAGSKITGRIANAGTKIAPNGH